MASRGGGAAVKVPPIESGAPFLEPRHDDILRAARLFSMRKLQDLTVAADTDADAASVAATRRLGKAGFLRHVVPRKYGGRSDSVDHRAMLVAREGIAYGSALAHTAFSLQALGSFPLTLAGSDAQRVAWLPKVAAGTAIAAFALTEPGAGSDAAAMATRARPGKAGGWILDGTKTFISNAGVADFYTLFAKTDTAAGHRGITCFLVPGDSPGLTSTPLPMLARHPIGTLRLRGVRVPGGAVVGEVGKGFYTAMETLDALRPTVASAACGLAARALDEAVRYAKGRKAFGRPIAENQGIRWSLADAAVQLMAARLLTYRAAWVKDRGAERITGESAAAKLFATEAAQRIIDLSLQVHGGAGAVRTSVPGRLYTEIRGLRIYEGTTEILREIVGRRLVG